jgi:UDP:flavonoid glycosyltransferase YjiC (YdhE family)
VRAVCRRFGAPVLSGLAELLAKSTPFLTSWPELEPDKTRTDTAYFGPMEGLGKGIAADWPEAPGPRLLVYLPMQSPQAAPLAAALIQRGWPVVWVSETSPNGALPDHIHHEVEPLAMAPALSAAALFVTRGGHGTALDAIAAGCPMLALPDTLEAERNARALAANGLAQRVAGFEHGWDADRIGAALDALVKPDAPERAAAAAAAARHADHDPAAAAASMARQMARALRLL